LVKSKIGQPDMSEPQFLVHGPKDNVGVVVVEGLKAGTDMLGVLTENDTTIRVKAGHDIPIGHKVALTDLKRAIQSSNMVRISASLWVTPKKAPTFILTISRPSAGRRSPCRI